VIRTLALSCLLNQSINFTSPSHIRFTLFSGVDVNAATEHKIKVARIPGSTTGNAVSCAEMAIYLTLGVLRKQVCVYCVASCFVHGTLEVLSYVSDFLSSLMNINT
jgi:hypothetical protein